MGGNPRPPSVQGAYWYEGQPWQRYELAPAGSTSGDGGIAAVSRIALFKPRWRLEILNCC